MSLALASGADARQDTAPTPARCRSSHLEEAFLGWNCRLRLPLPSCATLRAPTSPRHLRSLHEYPYWQSVGDISSEGMGCYECCLPGSHLPRLSGRLTVKSVFVRKSLPYHFRHIVVIGIAVSYKQYFYGIHIPPHIFRIIRLSEISSHPEQILKQSISVYPVNIFYKMRVWVMRIHINHNVNLFCCHS